ncbi:hypothetical protein M9H77_13802 [Catharanthus roseus]|uniref:Uncharacterized protein n=1 Tax=Catharanthus roseus TaxID=4058 RepID=A0ACC0BLH1_CATRO|nr:hypothetical protein M9H77_13802 [Catharanthus roseus]
MNEPLHLKVHISELSWLDSSLGMLDKDAKTFVTEHLSKVNAEISTTPGPGGLRPPLQRISHHPPLLEKPASSTDKGHLITDLAMEALGFDFEQMTYPFTCHLKKPSSGHLMHGVVAPDDFKHRTGQHRSAPLPPRALAIVALSQITAAASEWTKKPMQGTKRKLDFEGQAILAFLHPLTGPNFRDNLSSVCLRLHEWSKQTLGNFHKLLLEKLKALEVLQKQRGLPCYSSNQELSLIKEIERLQDLKDIYWKTQSSNLG